MQNASKLYKQSMKMPLRNRGYIRARIGIVNSAAQENISVDDKENSFVYFSDPYKPFNAYAVDRMYATGEKDFSKVDGSMYFLPEQNSGLEYYNNGIVTNDLSGSVHISFSGVVGLDIKGLTIDFGECYPTEFTIESDFGIKTYTNDKQVFVTEDVFNDTSYLIITPITMVNEYGRLRIHQFTCGISNNFSNKEVKSYSFKDCVSSIAETLPSQDMNLTVDNQNLYYCPDNPDSAIAYMEQGQEVKVSFGYDIDGEGTIEWINETTVFLKSWSATNTEAKFTAVDIFDYKLTGTYYRGFYMEDGIPLYYLAVDVLNDAGITDERKYFIDPYLKNILVYNPIPVVKHSEALQIIANAGRCVLYVDRQGRIHLQSSFVPDMTASSNDETEFSHVENVLKDDTKDAYAICSNDFSVVDGSLSFLPDDNLYLNTGYISNSISDANGNFEENPQITINLVAGYICYGITIKFRNIAPEELQIVTYYQNEEIQSLTVTDPDLEYITHDQFDLFDKMVIIFTKGYPNSRITLDNILLGDVTEYTISEKYNLMGSVTATRQNKIKSISVMRNMYRESTEEIKDLVSEELLLDSGDTEYVAHFSNASYGLAASVENGAETVEILESSNYYAKLKFSGVPEGGATVRYSVQGYEYKIDQQSLRAVHNENGEDIIWNNPLVSTVDMAKDLEEWLASYYLGDVDYKIPWNGDPRTDANDLFYLELGYRNDVLVRAYQNELKFNGAWNGTIKARKTVL